MVAQKVFWFIRALASCQTSKHRMHLTALTLLTLQAASAFRQPSTSCSTGTSIAIGSTLTAVGSFSCRPHSLKLSPGFHPVHDRQCRLFQTFDCSLWGLGDGISRCNPGAKTHWGVWGQSPHNLVICNFRL